MTPGTILAELRAAATALEAGKADRDSVARGLIALIRAQIALVEELVPPTPDTAPARPAGSPASAPVATPPPARTDVDPQAALEAFPLEDLNRWLDSGTIFQIRGDLAFLNLRSMGGLKVDEMKQNIRRLGFETEIGPLVVEGLKGEVCLFRRG